MLQSLVLLFSYFAGMFSRWKRLCCPEQHDSKQKHCKGLLFFSFPPAQFWKPHHQGFEEEKGADIGDWCFTGGFKGSCSSGSWEVLWSGAKLTPEKWFARKRNLLETVSMAQIGNAKFFLEMS